MVVLAGLLIASILLACAIGAVHVPLKTILLILLNHSGLFHFSRTWPKSDAVILLQIRLPRVAAAALVGAALSVAGVLFQGLLRNPMADPYVIGTSGGAALGAAVGFIISARFSILGFGVTPTFAFVGALATMIMVYRISRVGGRTPIVTLLLAGFAASVILGYTMSFLLIVNNRLQLDLPVLYAWLLGGITVTRWSQVGAIALIVAIGMGGALALGRSLNALSLGEECAASLGIPVELHKTVIIAVGSLLTAAAVSAGGLIGFVGLIVPHFVRLIFGPNHTTLLPLSVLGGAAFLVTADLLSRVILRPTELPVGILTAFIGGPAFLYLLRRTKQEYRF
ncbi:MAG TPA: iron chelate uptake ABC transporter family permease subunit [Terriglobia bacterium]|nr:iron chelate uptake ABC transporter family permease subunit [Terriglobia bacterium]